LYNRVKGRFVSRKNLGNNSNAVSNGISTIITGEGHDLSSHLSHSHHGDILFLAENMNYDPLADASYFAGHGTSMGNTTLPLHHSDNEFQGEDDENDGESMNDCDPLDRPSPLKRAKTCDF
jgi:hypothetical protein